MGGLPLLLHDPSAPRPDLTSVRPPSHHIAHDPSSGCPPPRATTLGSVDHVGKEPEGHRSLADQLRSWSEEALHDLLTGRPDLATPAPADFGQLAARATGQSSISRAM